MIKALVKYKEKEEKRWDICVCVCLCTKNVFQWIEILECKFFHSYVDDDDDYGW